jgi:SAM-dependent methyltransferase
VVDLSTGGHRAGRLWGAGVDAYEAISQTLADAISHCVARVTPRTGERVLDLGTGTARMASAAGGFVTGADVSEAMLAKAREFSDAEGRAIEWQHAEAERLPFPDATFDVVISTFGVIFAADAATAAREMARVCRRAGRLGITAWAPGGPIEEMQALRIRHAVPGTPLPPPPFPWGTPRGAATLLDDAFELEFEVRQSVLRAPDAETVWRGWSSGYGPTRVFLDGLSASAREAYRSDFIALHERFRGLDGITMPRDYLLIIGRRRD